LGQGQFGTVYQVKHLQMDNEFALKEISIKDAEGQKGAVLKLL
jgi:serine/threonine protein kinase